MNILFVSGELIAGNVAHLLQKEGHDVRLFVEHPDFRDGLNGFIEKVSDWKSELDWVGKDGLIVFDDVGYGKEQDDLRKDGYRVVGGSEGGDRLELDREYGQKMLAHYGMDIVPTYNFSEVDDAIAFVSSRPGTWVVKQNNHQSALNYVGSLSCGSDVLSVLRVYKENGIKNITLQEKIEGVEVSINRYFNGSDWVGPSEITLEHKSLCNNNLGPKTGEMGNLMWYDDNEGRLFRETIGRMTPFLRESNFRGDFDINCFIQGDRLIPIEATSRFGTPITHSQSVMHLSPWAEFLSAVADGSDYDLKHRDGYCIALTLAIPPFPYEVSLANVYNPAGLGIFFRDGVIDKEPEHFHFEGVRKGNIDGENQYFVSRGLGCVMYVTGYGNDVIKAREEVYARAAKVVIPKMFYRTDIGVSFLETDQKDLKEWGWI